MTPKNDPKSDPRNLTGRRKPLGSRVTAVLGHPGGGKKKTCLKVYHSRKKWQLKSVKNDLLVLSKWKWNEKYKTYRKQTNFVIVGIVKPKMSLRKYTKNYFYFEYNFFHRLQNHLNIYKTLFHHYSYKLHLHDILHD